MTQADPPPGQVDPVGGQVDGLRVDADPLRIERRDRPRGADRFRGEHDSLRAGLDPLRVEVDLLRLEAERLSAEVDPLRAATVVIVGVHYAPERIGFAAGTTALARDLAGIAERVVVFTGAPEPTGGPLVRIPGQTRRSVDHDHGVHLVRHHHRRPRSSGLSQARYERAFLRAVLGTKLRNPPDVVIGVLPSVGAALAAARVARRSGVPLLLVVQDLMATMTRDGGLVGSAVARGQAEALRQATRVVLVSAALRASVIALGVEKERIDVLPDWSHSWPERPEPAAARARIGVSADEFAVVHIGNVGPAQDVPTLVRTARRIAGRAAGPVRRELRLLVVGDGSQRQALATAAADLPAVRFLDPVTASEYPTLLAAADVLVVTEPAGCPDRTLPSRLESYLRAGRPIVAAINRDGAADRVLRTVPGAAVIVPPGDSGALAAVLVRLRDDEHERARLSEGARSHAEAAIRGAGAGRDLRDVVRSAILGPEPGWLRARRP